ncbi:MAG: S41 family peptidase [Thermoleophilia bacterium]|nr:S41 family peptidase [Thermoleophilia bacterium]
MRNSTKVTLLVVACVVAAVLLVGAGLLLGMNPQVRGVLHDLLPEGFSSWSSSSDDYKLQQEVLYKLQNTYYREIDPDTLENNAIDGMLAGLEDPYTVYMDSEEYTVFLEDTTGSYSGVGMVVELKDGLVTIVSTFKDTPADRAGIRSGDIVLSVDGVSTNGQTLDEVVGGIKGEEGTTVMLEMYRPVYTTTTTVAEGADGDPEEGDEAGEVGQASSVADNSTLPPGGATTEYTLTRKTIAIPVTESTTLETDGKEVAHISFFTFSEGSADELRSEVRNAVEVDGVDAIILDLRSNGGGLLNEAVDVASIFISKGTIVSTEGIHSPEQVYEATGDAFAQVPLYVLTNEYTASASEIVSGALQDYGRATLVGETTFGKGLVQSIVELSNGGALKVTSAVYLTPEGRDINKTGITPDVQAPDDPDTEVDEGVEAVLDLITGATVAR